MHHLSPHLVRAGSKAVLITEVVVAAPVMAEMKITGVSWKLLLCSASQSDLSGAFCQIQNLSYL